MKKILISSCLLGTPCRYDGKSVPCKEAEMLKEHFVLMPFCPECAGGLCTPRTPAERVGAKVLTKTGSDVTNAYETGAQQALALCVKHGITLAVLKEKSPSCGKGKIYDGTFSKTLTEGNGVTTELLIQNGITVYGEGEIEKILQAL